MTHSYKATCICDNLKSIRTFVEETIASLAFSEVERNRLVLAVDEVCANLIIHAHQCNPEDNIQINIHQQEHQLIFEIINRDHQPFDLKAYQNPPLSKIVQERRKGGLGLVLVSEIMDDVSVNVKDDTCTWQLTKELKSSTTKP